MLFTTAPFLLVFLPIALLGFYLLGRRSPFAASAWLFLTSVFFYGYWMPEAVLLLLASIALNFYVGRQIVECVQGLFAQRARFWLALGVTLNLCALGYFKYANFFLHNLDALLGVAWQIEHVVLPIGISFYTFTQIAFLVDAFAGKVNETRPVHYGLFVTYFPHLVAGPVLHHAQMMPQFADAKVYRLRSDQFVGGLAILALGMFKKVVLADGIAPYADVVFSAADAGQTPSAEEAALATVAYSLQLYFDFSGYSDMAIGLSRMFNIQLPFNFDSPYRAQNIAEFWRCWHMSLSRFLRDYLYIPLGGNRQGTVRRYFNLMVTMVLGGLWHGANWTFILWGTLHGLYLMVNQGFRAAIGAALQQRLAANWLYRGLSWALTLVAVMLAWVFFRAESVDGALRILGSLIHWRIGLGSGSSLLSDAGLPLWRGLQWCMVLGAAALYAPNSNQLGEALLKRLGVAIALRAVLGGAALCALLCLLLVNAARDSVSAFIYFNF